MFMKNSLFKFNKLLSITLISASLLFLTPPGGWAIEEFPVQFDQNDPYEIVLTAERYRQEFTKGDLEEEEWQEIYFNKAKELYEKAFLIDPYFSYGYLSYAYTQMLAAGIIGNKPTRYKKAAGLIPKMDQETPWPSLLQGQLHCINENWEKAKNSLDKAASIENNNSSIYAWLGYVLSALKQNDQAQQAYQKAIETNSDPKSSRWASIHLGKRNKPWQRPPIVPPPPPRRTIQPDSIKMRLQVVDFEDSTKSMGNAATNFSRLLATSLFKTKRFNMISGKESAEGVDTVLSGSIIKTNPKTNEFTLDIKATHPPTGNMLLAETLTISYNKQNNAFQIPDKYISKAAKIIENTLIKSEGRIIHIDGRHLMVNLGAKHGIQRGFTALIIGKSEKTVRNPLTANVLSRDVYLGEAVIERVEENHSYARLLTPGRISVQLGDIVRLK